jgi:predicted GNAT family acetyltransferase
MDTQVRRNDDENRYEILLDGRVVGIADFRVQGSTVVFPHTEIDPGLRGQGLGEILVQEALDDVRRSGRRVRAYCWFVREFLQQHAGYEDLVA